MNIVIERVDYAGKSFSMMTPRQLAEAGIPADIIKVETDRMAALGARDNTRARITATAGDIQSLLGTTADVAALGLLGAMQLVIILSEKGSPEVKAAIEAAPIKMPIDKAKALIAAIVKGDVKVPAIMKGIETVYAEVAQRSTATVNAMIPPKA
jgi:hypothetical protein